MVRRNTELNGGVPNVLLRFLVGIVLLNAIQLYTLIDTTFVLQDDKRCIRDIVYGTFIDV